MNRLYPVDYYDELALNTDNDYIYFEDSGDQLWRFPHGDRASRALLKDFGADYASDFPNAADFNHVHVTPDGTLLAIARDTVTDLYFMYRGIDQGDTWSASYVLRPGWTGSTHIAGRAALGIPSLANVTMDDGRSAILFAEYQTTDAAPHNLYVHISYDDGLTWAYWWSVSDGSAVIRHFHCIYQDPFTSKIIIGCGDNDTQNGIVIAPATTDLTALAGDNSPADINNSLINSVGNDQKYRVLNITFDEDYMYSHIDTTVEASAGIYRFNRVFSVYEKMYAPATIFGKTILGGGGIKTANGNHIFSDLVQSGDDPTVAAIRFHMLNDDKTGWETVARANLEDSWSGIKMFNWLFQDPIGDIWVCGTANDQLPGKANKHVPIFNEQGTWSADLGEEVIAPVYWVSQSGSDSNNGYRPSAPFATVSYAVTGDRMTFGARLILTCGLHTSATADIEWDTNPIVGVANETVIEGCIESGGQVWLEYDTGNAGQGFTIATADGDIKFRNMRVYDQWGNDLTAGTYTATLTENVNQGKINWR